MEIHHKILGLGVAVPHFTLVAVGVPGHLLGHVAVLLVLGYQLVVLGVLCGPALQRLPQHHRGLARPEMCCKRVNTFLFLTFRNIYFVRCSVDKIFHKMKQTVDTVSRAVNEISQIFSQSLEKYNKEKVLDYCENHSAIRCQQ